MEEQHALEVGIKELSQLLGHPLPLLQSKLIKSKRTSWNHDPFTRGGYAAVKPQSNNSTSNSNTNWRVELARPEENVLFFCGEATAYDSNPQTVHGAIDSGIRAATEWLQLLPRSSSKSSKL